MIPATATAAADATVAYTFEFEREQLNCLGVFARLCLLRGTSLVGDGSNGDSTQGAPQLDSVVFSLGAGPAVGIALFQRTFVTCHTACACNRI